MRMKFKILVRKKATKEEWWEEFDKEIGEEPAHVRGYGERPSFQGDPVAWGRAIVEWFNEGCTDELSEREFVRAVTLPTESK